MLLVTVASAADLPIVFDIRNRVFVVEQQVDPKEEYDVYEGASTHLIAFWDGAAVGTARFRSTEKGWKIERMAVLAPFRRLGVGKALLLEVLVRIPQDGRSIYLHAQEHALSFYKGLGFSSSGDRFYEADIPHRLCTYKL
ncbi:MAG: GNAT family N-acetyltransferase [Sphingomonadales bacterium]|nr:GNAT family N-acetyltransferase [Sphingomonadales bacterium]